MAKKDIKDLLKQETVTVEDKYLQVKVNRDGFTRTHEGQYSYKVVSQEGELFLFPVQTDGKGVLKVMKQSPIAYTDGDNIHFVVNTLTDPYTQAFIRTEDIKGLDKGKQLIQAFLAFVDDRFKFGVYNVFVADNKADVMSLVDAQATDADEVKEVEERAHEDLVAQFPTGNARENVKAVDSGEGQGDTSEPQEPSDVQVTPGEEDAEVTASASVKTIEPFSLTKLAGGTNGEPPASWAHKLEKFAHEGGYYVVPLSDKQSVHAEVAHFVKERSDSGEPMRAIVGGGINESKEQLFGRQSTLSNPRVALIANSGTFPMDDGRQLKAPAYMTASAIGGLVSGLDIGESITFKHIRISSLDAIYDSTDLDQLNENGIITIEFVRNRTSTNFRLVDDVTTFNDKSDPVKHEMAVGEANDFLVSELKVQLDDNFIGTRTINTSASVIKDFIQSYLDRKKRDNEIQDFPAEDVQVIVEGNEARISLTIYPIRSLKKISVSLVYRQQTLQA